MKSKFHTDLPEDCLFTSQSVRPRGAGQHCREELRADTENENSTGQLKWKNDVGKSLLAQLDEKEKKIVSNNSIFRPRTPTEDDKPLFGMRLQLKRSLLSDNVLYYQVGICTFSSVVWSFVSTATILSSSPGVSFGVGCLFGICCSQLKDIAPKTSSASDISWIFVIIFFFSMVYGHATPELPLGYIVGMFLDFRWDSAEVGGKEEEKRISSQKKKTSSYFKVSNVY